MKPNLNLNPDELKGKYLCRKGRVLFDPVKSSCDRIIKATVNERTGEIEAKVVSPVSKQRFWVTLTPNYIILEG